MSDNAHRPSSYRSSSRRLCAALAGLSTGRLAPCTLAGRLQAVDVAARRLALRDRSGGVTVEVGGERALPPVGSLVEVDVDEVLAPARLRAKRWRVLAEGSGEVCGESLRLGRLVSGVPRVQRLAQRGRALAGVRELFARRGYLEVQVPCRVRAPGLEPHLVAEPAGDGYLITSPEYHMKRLLAGGLERIYSLGPCWRGDEHGSQHLGEFTMIEWYRAYSDTAALMEETEALVGHVARALGHDTARPMRYQGRALELAAPFLRLTVAEAARRFGGVELRGVTETGELARRLVAAGYDWARREGAAFDELFSRLLVERVEPGLARLERPVFLHDFPAPLAALARLKEPERVVADRFELYAGGLELANAFGELTDPVEQRARLEADQAARRAAGAAVYPIDERFLDALAEGIPPSAGIALGFDRLLMLLCDAASIEEVVAFGPDEI